MKLAVLAILVLAACSHRKEAAKTKAPPASSAASPVQVQDSVHGVTYELLPGAEPWQVSREGNAHTASGVQVEVSSFPLARQATPAMCREHARARLSSRKEPDARNATPVDPPRDHTIGDAPTATWGFTTGPANAPVRNRWGFYGRGADCLVLEVSAGRGDLFADQSFEAAARSFKVLPLPPERQREIDLLAGMSFLERREPDNALDRFEALTQREPTMAKAHFGALMAGFEIGQKAYARALPHGKAALKAERELTGDQRELALRAVGVMQLAENEIRDAATTLAELVVRAPNLAEGQYNYACALARLGDSGAALDHLRKAIRLNSDLATNARDDEDLKSLRGSRDFEQLLATPQASESIRN